MWPQPMCSNGAYALLVVATSQSSAPSIGIVFNPEWVRVGPIPVGRAESPRMPHLSRPGWSSSPICGPDAPERVLRGT
jgi:hypothetical protein